MRSSPHYTPLLNGFAPKPRPARSRWLKPKRGAGLRSTKWIEEVYTVLRCQASDTHGLARVTTWSLSYPLPSQPGMGARRLERRGCISTGKDPKGVCLSTRSSSFLTSWLVQGRRRYPSWFSLADSLTGRHDIGRTRSEFCG